MPSSYLRLGTQEKECIQEEDGTKKEEHYQEEDGHEKEGHYQKGCQEIEVDTVFLILS
jgi:hypothetical protein